VSSRVFQATTGHTPDNPQICGLSSREINEDDWIMYLVVAGNDARPEYQIKVTREEKVKKKVYDRRKRKKVEKTCYERDYGMDDGRRFRSVFGGWQTNPSTGKREKVFTWQEFAGLDADGEEIWNPLKCWSHIVLAHVADELGYEVRKDKKGRFRKTTAHDGDRAVGNEHTVDENGVNAMEELARAACTDEELGLVPPSDSQEFKRIIEDENESISQAMNAEMEAEAKREDRLDAEALGLTLEQYYKLVAERG
jgi:hypothetical protein